MSDATLDSGVRRVERVLTIRRPADELYDVWRDFERLPSFMHNVVAVTEDGNRSHWVVKAPGGTVEWDAELIEEIPGSWLAWRTIGDADVKHRGEVCFKPASQGVGTEVYVALEWDPPAGALGAGVAKLFGDDPARQLKEDLWRFKQLMEAGRVPTTRGQSRGSDLADALEKERADAESEQLAEAIPYRD
jgi:uncharacterized membrane protein